MRSASEPNRVREYYDLNPHAEWGRLSVKGPAEFYTTLRVLDEYLGSGSKRVLDLGAGPGRIAIELVRRGHSVTVSDLSSASVQLAKDKAQESHVTFEDLFVADAQDLSNVSDASFDAVLSLGPMYHLLTKPERDKANRELARILKPGGVAFVAFITKSSVIRDNLLHCPERLVERKEHYDAFLTTGIIRQPPESGFVDFFAVHPDEVIEVMESANLSQLELIGCEGAMAFLHHKTNELEREAFEQVMDMNYKFVRDPSLLNASNHLLYVGRKNLHL